MDMSKYRSMFISETREHLQKMGTQLMNVETDSKDRSGIDALFREAHSIKGMAASMGYQQMADLAHHLEDILDLSRQRGEMELASFDHLLAGVDLIEALLEDIVADRPERNVSAFLAGSVEGKNTGRDADSDEPTESEEKSWQIDLKLLDSVASPAARMLVLLKQLEKLGGIQSCEPALETILRGGELRRLRVHLSSTQDQAELKTVLENYSEIAQLEIGLPKDRAGAGSIAGAATVRVGTELLDRFISLTGELITNRYMLQSAAGDKDWDALGEGLGRLARLVKELHHQVLQVRMMPIDSVTGRLPRLVRDLARKSGKKIRIELEGTGIELDRAILEELADPIIHMVRNAVDHGIGEEGVVSVRAWRQRDQVMLQVADNGSGMDPQGLRQRAIEKGIISPAQGEAMRDYDALQLICLPGFSTALQVSETSGRGVGMDVVKAAVEKLGGVLHIDSAPGRGARFTLKLPLSVAIIKVLLVRIDEKLVALPLTRVLQTLEIERRQIQTSGKQRVFTLQEELLPLLSLRKILGLPNPLPTELIAVVITEVLGRKVGLVVDGFAGQSEVFVQALPTPLDRLRGLGGGTILGDGRIVFILDVQGLLERRR